MIGSDSSTLVRVPVKEALSFGWQKTKQYFLILLGAGVLILVLDTLVTLPAVMHRVLAQDNQSFFVTAMWMIILLIANLGSIAITSIVTPGMVNLLLKASEDRQVSIKDLLSPAYGMMWLKYLGATYLHLLIVGLGILLFVVPGIIFGLKLQFFIYFIVDKNMGPVQALKASWNITKDVKMDLCMFNLSILSVVLLGVLVLVVGFVPACMVVGFAHVFIYKRLLQTAPEGSF